MSNCCSTLQLFLISNSANYMRVSRYIRDDNLDAAQAILDTIQDRDEIISVLPDKLMLQVSIRFIRYVGIWKIYGFLPNPI